MKQVENYLDNEKRMFLAKEFVRGAIWNILKNLSHYKKHGKDVSRAISDIKSNLDKVNSVNNTKELMGIEGNSRNIYYGSFSSILRKGFEFEKRTRNPPENMLNALISFGNSLMYTVCLTEIYNTQLNPTISYLHEPSERRFSLSLDLAEIFKPVIVDKVIFKMINNQMIKEEHFDKDLNFCYLKDSGRRLFLQEFDNRLKTTIMHKKLRRKVSYQHLIRLECYKLIKHLIEDNKYESLKVWW